MRNTIHNCFVDLTKEKPSEVQIAKVIMLLPSDIVLLADQWGEDDTEFGDKAFIWMRNNIELIS